MLECLCSSRWRAGPRSTCEKSSMGFAVYLCALFLLPLAAPCLSFSDSSGPRANIISSVQCFAIEDGSGARARACGCCEKHFSRCCFVVAFQLLVLMIRSCCGVGQNCFGPTSQTSELLGHSRCVAGSDFVLGTACCVDPTGWRLSAQDAITVGLVCFAKVEHSSV